MATATPSPTTARAPKRTQEQQLTDVLTKLLASMEERHAKMLAKRADAAKIVATMDTELPLLHKKIAAQRSALGITEKGE
jgi:hypothetical protein